MDLATALIIVALIIATTFIITFAFRPSREEPRSSTIVVEQPPQQQQYTTTEIVMPNNPWYRFGYVNYPFYDVGYWGRWGGGYRRRTWSGGPHGTPAPAPHPHFTPPVSHHHK